MRFIVRLAFLLGILGALFWGDVLAFMKVAPPKDQGSAEQRVEAEPSPGREPETDAREAARREFERLRQENLADADAEARRRTIENEAADREEEIERLREAREESERARPPMHRRAPGGPRPGLR
jgi:hypothetical protein